MTGAAPTAPVLGFTGKLYYNAGTYGSPTWTVINNVGDVKSTLDADESDIGLRSQSGFWVTAAGLIKCSWEWSSIWDPSDTALIALQTNFYARTPTEFLILDEAYTITGAFGIRAMCQVFKFPRQEELSKAMMIDVSIKPTYSGHAPATYTAA